MHWDKKKYRYVIVTAARNEVKYIEGTIMSVISQTIMPQKWVIASDGSTDGTDEIVSRYAKDYKFIELIRIESAGERNYRSKVNAIEQAVMHLNGIEYDFIQNLDADVTFDSEYYEKIFEKFETNPKLGISGGIIFDKHRVIFHKQFAGSNSVAGAIQMFRRECYKDIGGYRALHCGGEDAVAEVMARMKGWEVRSFADIKVMHHKRSGEGNSLAVRFRQGIMENSLGYHPVFETARCFVRIKERPYIAGSFFRLSGYLFAKLRRDTCQVSDEVARFLRREQMTRLSKSFSLKKEKKENKRICVIRHGYYLKGPRVAKEVRALYESGYCVDVICLRNKGEKRKEKIDGVHIYRLSHQHRRGSLIRYMYEYCLSFFKMSVLVTLLHLRNRYKCIQVNTLPDILVFATIIPRLFGTKVLLDMHEPTPELFLSKYGPEKYPRILRLITILEQASLKYSNAAITVNDSLRRKFIERGADGQKIHVVRNVPAEEFCPGNFSENMEEGFKLLTHGMIAERYGQEVVIRALPLIRDKIDKLMLFIAGYGQYTDKVRELTEKLGCSDIVTFTGQVPFSRIKELIIHSHIGIVPLLRSPFTELCQPNKIFEYIAFKVPVIVSRLKAIEESFDDSCVMYFEPGNEKDLARCIVELYRYPEKRQYYVENAFRRYEPMRWNKTKYVYLGVVDKLINHENRMMSNQK